MKLQINELGLKRKTIIQALNAEGIREGISAGYANIHMLPMYQKKLAYGNNGFPWTSDIYKGNVSYEKGCCPVAEELHESSFIGFEMCLYALSDKDIKNICTAFTKIWENLEALREFERNNDNFI